MNFTVAGSNVFGQWLLKERIIDHFRALTINDFVDDLSVNKCSKLLLTTWSYNIFHCNEKFFICGSCINAENGYEEIKIPLKSHFAIDDLQFVGNHYFLMLLDRSSRTLWRCYFDSSKDWNWQQVPLPFINTDNLNSETSSSSKKIKMACGIQKVCLTDSACLCLTNDGDVYEMPSRVDVSQCVGKVCDIQCGYEHKIVLTDEGGVYTWGNGRRCQLGHGDIDNLEEPTEVEALAGINIVKIQAGGWHTLALSDCGDLYVWGWNETGQLGICEDYINENILKSYPLPIIVDFYDNNGDKMEVNVKDIAAGTRHSVILLDDNTVWGTGFNKYGQLGVCPKSYSDVKYFKKTFDCETNCALLCGPWCSMMIMH